MVTLSNASKTACKSGGVGTVIVFPGLVTELVGGGTVAPTVCFSFKELFSPTLLSGVGVTSSVFFTAGGSGNFLASSTGTFGLIPFFIY